MKQYADPRARQIAGIDELIQRGSAPTGELIEACRDLNAAMARWGRRVGFDPRTEVIPPKDIA